MKSKNYEEIVEAIGISNKELLKLKRGNKIINKHRFKNVIELRDRRSSCIEIIKNTNQKK